MIRHYPGLYEACEHLHHHPLLLFLSSPPAETGGSLLLRLPPDQICVLISRKPRSDRQQPCHKEKKKKKKKIENEDAGIMFVVRVVISGPSCLRSPPSAPSAYKRHIHGSLNDIPKVIRAHGVDGGGRVPGRGWISKVLTSSVK